MPVSRSKGNQGAPGSQAWFGAGVSSWLAANGRFQESELYGRMITLSAASVEGLVVTIALSRTPPLSAGQHRFEDPIATDEPVKKRRRKMHQHKSEEREGKIVMRAPEECVQGVALRQYRGSLMPP